MATIDVMTKQRARLVRMAEKRSGFKEGGYLFDAGNKFVTCVVSVSFYGGESWWLDRDGVRVPLTRELWARVRPLKLD